MNSSCAQYKLIDQSMRIVEGKTFCLDFVVGNPFISSSPATGFLIPSNGGQAQFLRNLVIKILTGGMIVVRDIVNSHRDGAGEHSRWQRSHRRDEPYLRNFFPIREEFVPARSEGVPTVRAKAHKSPRAARRRHAIPVPRATETCVPFQS